MSTKARIKARNETKLRNDIVRFLWTIGESIPSVKYTEVVDILNVVLMEIEAEGEPFKFRRGSVKRQEPLPAPLLSAEFRSIWGDAGSR